MRRDMAGTSRTPSVAEKARPRLSLYLTLMGFAVVREYKALNLVRTAWLCTYKVLEPLDRRRLDVMGRKSWVWILGCIVSRSSTSYSRKSELRTTGSFLVRADIGRSDVISAEAQQATYQALMEFVRTEWIEGSCEGGQACTSLSPGQTRDHTSGFGDLMLMLMLVISSPKQIIINISVPPH